jgi:predicted RND superfamily exporter protein
MSALAAYGIERMQPVSHSLDALFESDTAEYRRYAEMRAAFPLNERDLIVVASSPRPFTPAEIASLRDLHLELQLLDQVGSVLSLFSIRGSPDADGYASPLIPDELPEGAAFEELMAETAAHPFIAGKLLNATPQGGQALVIVAGMKAEAVDRVNLIPTIDALTGTADTVLAGSGVRYEVFGVPLLQRDIRLASRSDRITFNVAGFLIGLVIALFLFRDAKLVLIATLCPVIANFWAFGLFGLINFPMSFFTNAIPPLVLVISFAEAMHLTYGIRRHLRAGKGLSDSVRETIAVVGPGCVLTTVTTATAFPRSS